MNDDQLDRLGFWICMGSILAGVIMGVWIIMH